MKNWVWDIKMVPHSGEVSDTMQQFSGQKKKKVISVKNPETGQYKPPIFQVVNKLNTSTATISCFVLDS